MKIWSYLTPTKMQNDIYVNSCKIVILFFFIKSFNDILIDTPLTPNLPTDNISTII